MNTLQKSNLTEDILSSFPLAKFGEANDSRKQAVIDLKSLGLPSNKTEEYRFTPITKHLEKNISWENRISWSDLNSIDNFLIPGLDANVLVFINGSYSEKFSKIISPKEQLEITTLGSAFLSKDVFLNQHFNTLVNSENDSFASLNTAFWQEGLYLKIPDTTRVEKPVFLLHINDASQEQIIAHTRLLISIGVASEFTLIEKFDSVGSNPIFHTFTEEIIVKDNASLEYYKIQNDKGTSQVCNTAIHQADSSKVNAYTLTMAGQIIRNNFNIAIDGKNCESHFNGLYILNGNTIADNHTVVDHKQPNSYSNELYKGIMDDNSKGVFNGKIYVRPQAQKTNAFQSNRNILVSDTATIDTKPQLEIWADDVKCSHGCTTGQLDEEALFYLQSRGISKQSAQAMLLYAFAADVIEPMKNEQVKGYFDTLISERLQKNF